MKVKSNSLIEQFERRLNGSLQLLEAMSSLIQQNSLLILFWVVAAMNEPNDGTAEKIEQVARIVVERDIVLKGVKVRKDLVEIGIFSLAELDTSLIRKIQGKVKRKLMVQEHCSKIGRRQSFGAINSPAEAVEHAAGKMAVTETKGTFPVKNHATLFKSNGIVVEEREIKAEVK
jgi:hypothetical protein